MELSQLLNRTAEIPAEYQGFKFLLHIFTEKLTPTYKARLLVVVAAANETPEGEASPEVKDENAQLLADLIESWKDGDGDEIVLNGQPFPPTYEHLAALSYQMIASLTRTITTFLGELANPTKETN